jgi:hypothetical protein
MVDQYYLWRTGRAVSAALVILFFEVLFLVPCAYELPFLLGFLLPSAVTVLGAVIALDVLPLMFYPVRIGVCDLG